MRYSLLVFLCLFCAKVTFAQSPIRLITDKYYNLGEDIAVWEDRQHLKNIEKVLQTAHFQKSKNKTVNFGYSKSAIWLRLEFSVAKPHEKWFMSVGTALQDTVELHYKDKEGRWQMIRQGSHFPYFERQVKHRFNTFLLPFQHTETHTFYVRVAGKSPLVLPVIVQSEVNFYRLKANENLGYGIYFGILLAMMVYNIFLFYVLRDVNYLYYVLSIFSILMLMSSLSGYSFEYIWGDYGWGTLYQVRSFVGFIVASTGIFAISFLRPKVYAPIFYYLLWVMTIWGILLAPLIIWADMLPWGNLTITIHSILLLLAGIICWRKGNQPARFYVLAWFMYILGGISNTLRNMNIMSHNVFASYGTEIGSAIETLLLAFALSDRYRLIRREKDLAQKETIRLQQETNETLEQKVRERTAELFEKNEELNQINEELNTTLDLIETEKQKSDNLLLNILPNETAQELKETGTALPKHYKLATVLFTDFKNFTEIAEHLTPEELIEELNICFTAFDEICTRHNLEKIKTIGDAYMAVGGIPVANHTNPTDTIYAALEIVEWIQHRTKTRTQAGKLSWDLRIGVHSGEVVAGVIGKKKFAYDIWGDTVNLAARMESSGEVGKVNISGVTYTLVKDKFECAFRGKIEAKNKGEVEMYFVLGIK
jgi:class 3 adenylate cyclase